jgi:hypothetical protein
VAVDRAVGLAVGAAGVSVACAVELGSGAAGVLVTSTVEVGSSTAGVLVAGIRVGVRVAIGGGVNVA